MTKFTNTNQGPKQYIDAYDPDFLAVDSRLLSGDTELITLTKISQFS